MPYADPQKLKAWRDANRDKLRAQSAKYNQSEAGKAYKAESHKRKYQPRPRVLLDPEERLRRRREANRAWLAANPDKMKAIKRRYRDENVDKVREAEAAYRAANIERRREQYRAWEDANPDKRRALNQKRRSRERGADGHFTDKDIASITKAQKSKCACCRKKRKLTVDHIVPLSKGGTNWPQNIQMLCGKCNSAKKDRDPIEHRQSLGQLL